MFNLRGGGGGENEVDNSWDLNLVLLNFCFERISIIHCFLFHTEDGSLSKPKRERGYGRKWVGTWN